MTLTHAEITDLGLTPEDINSLKRAYGELSLKKISASLPRIKFDDLGLKEGNSLPFAAKKSKKIPKLISAGQTAAQLRDAISKIEDPAIKETLMRAHDIIADYENSKTEENKSNLKKLIGTAKKFGAFAVAVAGFEPIRNWLVELFMRLFS